MLASLSIRDVVLIDRLDLAFERGLCVLTGETGAGKSILLDAVGLVLGARADARLVRPDAERAMVAAEFDLPPDHPALALLREQELPAEGMVVRRTIAADGRSRAFVNDAPASVGLLRQLGDLLVEIQGQNEQRGLADPAAHRPLLDGFGRLDRKIAETAEAHRTWREAEAALQTAASGVEDARRNETFLRTAVEELDRIEPKLGEETELSEQRILLMSRERIVEAVQAARTELSAGRGVDAALRNASRSLERIADKAGGTFDAAIAALDRAAIEIAEASNELDAAAARIESSGARLEQVEERLFALRAVARKHDTDVESLVGLREALHDQLNGLEDHADRHRALEVAATEARERYLTVARALTAARTLAAGNLDGAVAGELPPLKLERARFRTRIDPLPESAWGAAGVDRVSFEVATNVGSAFGAIDKVASGGELSRFMLALKVSLATAGSAATLIFDEVDAGVGGAVAAAVGARLARLAETVQILVVTHSPQVAARGRQHLQVAKQEHGGVTVTAVSALSPEERREEIARMLSGARITDEARAAADSLMAQGEA